MKTVESILRDARKLTVAERTSIAAALVADLCGGHNAGWDLAWASELDKRSANADEGFESWSTPAEILAETKARLGVK